MLFTQDIDDIMPDDDMKTIYMVRHGETEYNLQNLSNFGLCPVVRFGWRWFNVYASYSLISVYEASVGNKIKPISLGISFTPGR